MKVYEFEDTGRGRELGEVGEAVRFGLDKYTLRNGVETRLKIAHPPKPKIDCRETWEWCTHIDVRGPDGLEELKPEKWNVGAICCCTDQFIRANGGVVEFWHVVGTTEWVKAAVYCRVLTFTGGV